ncbi:Uncharacterised protein [Acinetobacter baumannii]|nr:Uncharacterised protein [Acinetobacter baumannii]
MLHQMQFLCGNDYYEIDDEQVVLFDSNFVFLGCTQHQFLYSLEVDLEKTVY